MPKSLASLRATAYKIPKGSVLIDLTCGHSAWYVRPVPAPGTDAFCRTCDTWRQRKRARKARARKSAGPADTRPGSPGGGHTRPGHGSNPR